MQLEVINIYLFQISGTYTLAPTARTMSIRSCRAQERRLPASAAISTHSSRYLLHKFTPDCHVNQTFIVLDVKPRCEHLAVLEDCTGWDRANFWNWDADNVSTNTLLIVFAQDANHTGTDRSTALSSMHNFFSRTMNTGVHLVM